MLQSGMLCLTDYFIVITLQHIPTKRRIRGYKHKTQLLIVAPILYRFLQGHFSIVGAVHSADLLPLLTN